MQRGNQMQHATDNVGATCNGAAWAMHPTAARPWPSGRRCASAAGFLCCVCVFVCMLVCVLDVASAGEGREAQLSERLLHDRADFRLQAVPRAGRSGPVPYPAQVAQVPAQMWGAGVGADVGSGPGADVGCSVVLVRAHRWRRCAPSTPSRCPSASATPRRSRRRSSPRPRRSCSRASERAAAEKRK